MRKFMIFGVLATMAVSSSVLASVRPLGADHAAINPNAPVYTGSANVEALTVVPAGVESSDESGLSTIIRQVPRSYQEYIAANNLSSITESVNITGMQLRLAIGENWRPSPTYLGQSWPNAPISIANFDVRLGEPSAQMVSDGEYLSGSSVYANFITNSTLVRSGALNIATGDYQADGGATGIHSWGPVINFSTPYQFNPGEGLMVQVNHNGYGASVEQAFFASREFENGVTDAVASTAANAYTATSANGFSSPYFIQFTYSAVPEPATLGVLTFVGVIALKRRK